MELDVESVRDYRSTICEHVVEQVVVFLLLSLIELGFCEAKLDGDNVEDLQEPANREWVPR